MTNSSGWASDGLLDIKLDPIGYDDIYVRFYIKFQQGWRWLVGGDESPMQKFLHISHNTKTFICISALEMGNERVLIYCF